MPLQYRSRRNHREPLHQPSIETVDRELLKYEVENIRWAGITDEHKKAITFLSLREKDLIWRKESHNMAVASHACLRVSKKALF